MLPTSRRRRPRAVIALLAAVAVVLIVPSAFAQYPLTSGTLDIGGGAAGSEPLQPGDPVSLEGGGFEPGTDVEIWLNSDPILIDTVSASAAGAIDVRVEIPSDAPAGRHTLEARGAAPGGGAVVLEAPVVIAEASSTRDREAGAPASAPARDREAAAPGPDGEAAGPARDSGRVPLAATREDEAGPRGALPFTGMPLLTVVVGGVALLLAGGLLAVVAGRR